ncbi:catalase [Streptomyces sp. NRRL S-1521]|uniref:catalase n=1 Tax=Streptomyces sp. NRRL S-1521 TaxID=1609100 RepID=UPI0007464E55|nr:catalase [Streptomyces sp. NRRL S-1521]KUL57613.1 catalase [Streptomyces sp. NRRL S-1521]
MTDVSSKGPAPDDDRATLTNRQGHPVHDNQNQRTVGARGPATLENYQFLEKISHFDRERIPERVVHARGVTAYGFFEAYGTFGDEPIARFTRAKLFQERGKRTDVAVRFSTVIGGRDSSEAARDPRGFAVKFYTEDGNWDLVGNNLGVFFIRDAIKFPDVIHALKPDPVTFEQQPRRIFDFMSQTPECMHMLVNLFSPRGIPADYRHMQGFGVNTYKWINEQGESLLVKYHWMPKQGVRSMTEEDAANVQAQGLGHATKDLYEAVSRGDHPEWELLVQVMDDHDHPELDFDPLDDTKTWPEQDFPPQAVGRMVLDRMPANFFAENEQISFGTGVLVDGLDFSDDKMLVGRTFSYSDTQRYRVGPNYLQLPVNQAKNAHVRTNQRDGQMAYYVDGGGENPIVNYEPSITGGLREAQYPTLDEQGPEIRGRLTRKRIPRTNDYQQAGQRYLLMEQWERDDLVRNVVGMLSQCDRPVQERMVWHFLLVENDLGLRIGEGLGIGPKDVAGLQPLASQDLTDEDRKRLANLGENPPRDVEGLTMTHCVPDERHVVSR